MVEGKNVLVTGGSSGIGQATALAFAKAGANVCVNSFLDAENNAKTVAEIQALGVKALGIESDISDLSAVENVVTQFVDHFGDLDFVVNSAYFSKREPFWTADLEGFTKTIQVTMMGSYYLLRTATNQMIKQGHGGAMLFVSSPHAYGGYPGAMAYNMAKGALDQMAKTAATELLEHRIRVNVIYPGWIDTPGERNYATEEEIREAEKKLPWGRLGTPEEVAKAILFMLDPETGDYITGGSLLMDGGYTLPWWTPHIR